MDSYNTIVKLFNQVVKDAKDTKNPPLADRVTKQLEGALVERGNAAKPAEMLKDVQACFKKTKLVIDQFNMDKWLTKIVKKKAAKNKTTETKLTEAIADLQKALMILSIITLGQLHGGKC